MDNTERKRWGKIWKIPTDDLRALVKRSHSLAMVLRGFGFRNWSSIHYQSLRERLVKDSIDFTHIGNGLTNRRHPERLSQEESLKRIFIDDSPYHQRTVREYVKKYSLLPYQCECGQASMWHDKLLTLQLDHKSGDNKDQRLDNLRWLCPNCHSQTPTFGIKNKGSFF